MKIKKWLGVAALATVAILIVVALSAFFSEFPQAARAKPATVARAATPSHFFNFS